MQDFLMKLLPLTAQGYCCSQLLMLLLLEAQGRENAALVRAMQGLCHGIGQSNASCGLLTGGAAVLACVAGKGAAAETPHPMLEPLLNDYALWFYDQCGAFGGHTCEAVMTGLSIQAGKPLPASGRADLSLCGVMLGRCWEKILELADAYDIDLTA